MRLRAILGLAFVWALSGTATAQKLFPSDADVAAAARNAVAIEARSGVVIGLLEADGSRRVVPVANVPMDGRTIFEIGSITKVFTGILLAEMAQRGEVHLEDPVEDLLPRGTAVPSRNGRRIRLVDLATHSSGLPRMPNNFAPADPKNPYIDYSDDRLYVFLEGYQLTRDVGERVEYSNLGAALLGHALALRAGKPYERLVTERILGPLGMTSTRIVLSADDRARLAQGHSASGQEVANWDLTTFAGAGGLRSTTEDMLKFLAANLTPPDSSLGRAIRESQVPRFPIDETSKIGLHWLVRTTRFGRTIVWHNGGTAGYRSYIGFDSVGRHGVVVLSNRSSADRLGLHLLDSREPVSVSGLATTFRVLPICLATLLVAAVLAAWRRTGASWRAAVVSAVTTAVALVVWMAGTTITANRGLLRFDTTPPTMLLVIAAVLIVTFSLATSSFGRRLAMGLPLWILVGAQAFRLPLELMMHRAYEVGLMPVQMSYSGANFDIVTGALAAVVAPLVATGRADLRIVRGWNYLGTLLLCNIIVIALLSTPTPLRVFTTVPANTWITAAPYVWLPSVMVPFAILGHIVICRRLRAMSQARTKME
jgi:CubicO group peptidase (beta-lactamase class C family)